MSLPPCAAQTLAALRLAYAEAHEEYLAACKASKSQPLAPAVAVSLPENLPARSRVMAAFAAEVSASLAACATCAADDEVRVQLSAPTQTVSAEALCYARGIEARLTAPEYAHYTHLRSKGMDHSTAFALARL